MRILNAGQFILLKKRSFLPLFLLQFLGAFHDNLFKSSLVALLLYGPDKWSSVGDPKFLVTVLAGLFILPFMLFSAFAGQLADKLPKEQLIRYLKLAEMGIAICGAAAFFYGSINLSFIVLVLLGLQSAFFGPAKYSILPQLIKEEELIGGNALINTGTFLAILTGTTIGSACITLDGGILFVSGLLLLVAVSGYVASLFMIGTEATQPDLNISRNPLLPTIETLANVKKQSHGVFMAVMGVAWFYFMGGMFMTQLPNLVKDILGGDEAMLTVFLVIFSVGIAIGGLFNNRLLKGRVQATYVPLAAIGISIFSFGIYFASSGEGVSVWHFINVAMVSMLGGLFVVPLNTIIQHRTSESSRAKVIAGSAIMNAVFVAVSSAICALLLSFGVGVSELFLVFAIANSFVAVYICGLMPSYLLKAVMQGVLKLAYGIEVRGLEHFDEAGEKAVIVCNHVSFLDAPILAAFLPGRPVFAINSNVANWWWVKPFLSVVDAFPLDPTNPFSTKALIRKVEEGRHCVIFPEGRLTETGALMKVYQGPGLVADKSGAPILPVRLDGVQHTPFARLKNKVPLKSFPRITMTILPPRNFSLDSELWGRERRQAAARQLYVLMEEMMFLTEDREQTLYSALLRARHINGDKTIIAEDPERKPISFKTLIRGSVVLGRKIKEFTEKGENVGLMLPNSTGTVVSFFALQGIGRVPAMLNFSSGTKAVISSCEVANIKTVITSRRFIEAARLDELAANIGSCTNLVYLEDLREKIGFFDKFVAMVCPVASAKAVHKRVNVAPCDPAMVLFTSGTEGAPKGVVLSHSNVMSNVVQLGARVDFNRQDIVFNCLPMFHSFGLTGGTLLPIISGIRTFLYPSPLHFRIVPELVYSANATIMFGTDTFLSGYARMADPYDFYRMRYIFAGAEKLKDTTRKVYMENFGVRILEGYGATETSPVIAVNSPMCDNHGTVGKFLPGIEYMIEDVPGVNEGGRLLVKGPNVMLGYYLNGNPGVIDAPEGGWYDTGDIVSVDRNGFVRIVGRAKRFAKIAGEMISLALSEDLVRKVWPNSEHAVVAIPDPKKGEQLVLVTTQKQPFREELSAQALKSGISELAVPRKIIESDDLPLLATGKVNYPELQKRVMGSV